MTRADIIQAAFKAWGRDYYRSTSLSEVARELGVSKPALYRHFCNKQALLEAMYEWFLDDYAAKVQDGFLRATAAEPNEAISIMIRAIMSYYAHNAYLFIFSIVHVYGERRLGNPQEFLAKRGIDMGIFSNVWKIAPFPRAIQMILATLTFAMAYYHQLGPSGRTASGIQDERIEQDISLVLCIVSAGLGFQKKGIETLDYGLLEEKVSGIGRKIEENELLHSVAEAVASAGPWGVSMKMVARVSGLSKSGLYAHFKNKGDMLAQLFLTEFDRIINFAEESIGFSANPEERLYLAIFAICDYLRSRPDVLIALDWLRVRRIEVSDPEGWKIPPRLYRVFRDVQQPLEISRRFPNIESDWIPAWILFLIFTSLMHGVLVDTTRFMEWLNMPKLSRRKLSREAFARVSNESFRNLYQFIVRGLDSPSFTSAPPPDTGGEGI
ncbi:MAG: TetR/AcrR family transcriptional regulator [Treponema sp.]|jgi:AcrR family transcriptional regulator|nr:TetR/AcrR family transcriptional regulator [Treponema sp.]